MGAATANHPTPPLVEPPATAAAQAGPEMLTPGSAALILNVSESDVLSALADGSLKGKKIGSSWRVTRAALEDFMKS